MPAMPFPCHATNMPFWKRPLKATAVSWQGRGRVTAWYMWIGLYVVICGLSGCTIFSTLSHKRHDFRDEKNYCTRNVCFDVFYNFCLKRFSLYEERNGTYSAFGKSRCTYKRCLEVSERTIVSKNWIKLLHALLVLHFRHCLTTEYSETTSHFNGNFDADNQIYVP
jgi:hypothetical protein